MKKFLSDILLFLVILFCPWWLAAMLGIFLLFYFKTYNEIILFGLIMDIYYSKLAPSFSLLDYKNTLISLLLLIVAHLIKKRLKFYVNQ